MCAFSQNLQQTLENLNDNRESRVGRLPFALEARLTFEWRQSHGDRCTLTMNWIDP